jgi:hypothetical protein
MSELELAIVQKVIAVVLSLVATFATPIIGYYAAMALAALKRSNKWDQVRLAVRTAVRSAEQLDLAGDLDLYADNKLDAAFVILEEQLAAVGVPIDLDQYRPQLRQMIEEAVKDLNLEQEFGLGGEE